VIRNSDLHNEILKTLAPCGLNCGKCLFNKEGEIKDLSCKLKDRLGNFESYAERFAKGDPVFNNYGSFGKLLNFFTSGDCPGCRMGGCRFPGCNINNCISGRGLDFCYQCEEFPCERSNLQGALKERWIRMNNRMKEKGIQNFYEESRNEPRYI